MKRDYYEILGINKSASTDDIKAAYRTLALKYHPDRNQGEEKEAEEKFKEVGEAYAILIDPQKRSIYDQFGHDGPNRVSNINVGDIFDQFFNAGFGRRRKKSGLDTRGSIDLTLEEIATGCEKQVTYSRQDRCNKCHGIGGSGKPYVGCRGRGKVSRQHGPFTVETACIKCQGKKIKITSMCDNCNGKGNLTETQTISIKVPPGINDGETLVLQGHGGLLNPGEPRGDLLCRVRIQPHSDFSREGAHLLFVKPLQFSDLCTGTRTQIKTIYGKTVELQIPTGSQFG